MANLVLVLLALGGLLGVAYGLYAGHRRREAERRLNVLAQDRARLVQRLGETKAELAEIEDKQEWAAERERIMRRLHGV